MTAERPADLTVLCEFLRTGKRNQVVARVYAGVVMWRDAAGVQTLDLRGATPVAWDDVGGALEGVTIPCRCGLGGHHPTGEWVRARGRLFVLE